MSELITPDSEEALSDFVREAKQNRSRIRIIGGGTRQGLGNPVFAQSSVSTASLSGISLYEPGALTMVAEAGTPLSEIKMALGAEHQHLPFEPADYRDLYGSEGEPTIGGVVASGISGPRRIQAGACRDSLIGVRFVDGMGEIIKNGGRVMKNVTGYDLVKLMCGSYGTLGILSEVSFKLLPMAETSALVMVHSLPDSEAIAALTLALGSPYDVTGASHLQRGDEGKAQTLIRVEGFEGSVKYRAEKLKELLSGFGEVTISLDHEQNQEQMKMVRDVKPFGLETDTKESCIWKLSVKPSDGPRIVMALQQQIPLEAIYDWGGGLIWLRVDTDDNGSASSIRNAVNSVGGHAMLVRASESLRSMVGAFHPQNEILARMSLSIRAKYDPSNILNPDLMKQVASV